MEREKCLSRVEENCKPHKAKRGLEFETRHQKHRPHGKLLRFEPDAAAGISSVLSQFVTS